MATPISDADHYKLYGELELHDDPPTGVDHHYIWSQFSERGEERAGEAYEVIETRAGYYRSAEAWQVSERAWSDPEAWSRCVIRYVNGRGEELADHLAEVEL